MNIIKLLKENELKKGRIKTYKKNQIIFHEQDECNNVGFIIDGEIIISSYQLNGQEDIYNHLFKNDVFGNALIFSTSCKYLGNVIALSDCKIFFLDKNNLISILQTNVEFLTSYISLNSKELFQSKLKLKLLSKSTLEEKILYYLSLNNNQITISITKLSKILFVQRPSLSRSINKLIKDGYIVKNNKTITLLKELKQF